MNLISNIIYLRDGQLVNGDEAVFIHLYPGHVIRVDRTAKKDDERQHHHHTIRRHSANILHFSFCIKIHLKKRRKYTVKYTMK